MRIKSLNIKNFKSIADITLVEPNPFTVFVGSNGAGKSNIFEALEYVNAHTKINFNVDSIFGGAESIYPFRENPIKDADYIFQCIAEFNHGTSGISANIIEDAKHMSSDFSENLLKEQIDKKIIDQEFSNEINQYHKNFSRIFISDNKKQKFPLHDSTRLSSDGSNLEKVLERILSIDHKKEELIEWLSLFVPEFENIIVHKNELDGNSVLSIKENHTNKHFNKKLISDGTLNILCLLTAVYQSNKPQFILIEEPENGLNPYVVKKLVNFFRTQCEEKGHYIWLNTHSQSLVSQLTPEEIILVDKKQGATQIKQIKDNNLHGLTMDEAWLSNALGGGLPW